MEKCPHFSHIKWKEPSTHLGLSEGKKPQTFERKKWELWGEDQDIVEEEQGGDTEEEVRGKERNGEGKGKSEVEKETVEKKRLCYRW